MTEKNRSRHRATLEGRFRRVEAAPVGHCRASGRTVGVGHTTGGPSSGAQSSVNDDPWAWSVIAASASDSDCLNSAWKGHPARCYSLEEHGYHACIKDVLSGEVA